MWVGNKAYSRLITELRGSVGFWNTKKTYLEIAQRIGVDEETVRNRIKHLKEDGLFLGWRLLPNPMVLNRKTSFLLMKSAGLSSKKETISRIESSDGVVQVINYYGDELLITLFDDSQKRSSDQILKMGEVKSPIVSEINVPPTCFQMTALDWKICGQLLRNAERKIADITAVVGVSEKTVKRRLNKMLESSAIFILPMIDLRKMSGVAYDLMIQSQSDKKAQVESLVLSRVTNLVFVTGDSSNGSFITFATSNISEGDEIFQMVKERPEVKSATLSVIEEVKHDFIWLVDECERRSK